MMSKSSSLVMMEIQGEMVSLRTRIEEKMELSKRKRVTGSLMAATTAMPLLAVMWWEMASICREAVIEETEGVLMAL